MQNNYRNRSPMPPPPPPPARHSHNMLQLSPTKSPSDSYTFRNLVAVSTRDVAPSRDGYDQFFLLQRRYVVSVRPTDAIPSGQIGLSSIQRTWMNIALTDMVSAEPFDLFAQGGQAYLGSVDIEIAFAGRKGVETPYDQDELAKQIVDVFNSQIFAPGQRFMMDVKSIPLALMVKTVQLVDLSEKPSSSAPLSDPSVRGLLTPQTQIAFFKDPKSPINLKASSKRPAPNAIISPDFKFEDMGIGGLDSEFSTIFRRAFASRIFPPGIVEKLGVRHAKGILLYGPPGTGKTTIARQIGKMLNAREPKVVNGPEVLNKFVGQSEENIRKLFADAEKEYKEKGEESGLHIIIFDELDAICKQRGSTASSGTGVGDTIVNQLLSKLDGVDRLNNILLIGMTNRKDLIDDALLRQGRLDIHVEISLPDEEGRRQILKIHTANMKEKGALDDNVNIDELAHRAKNFSGAELEGLIRAATSFAFNRHVKVGTVAGVNSDVDNIKINRDDFMHAFDEVKPDFGVAEADMAGCLHGGIVRYSSNVNEILKGGQLYVQQIRSKDSKPLYSLLLHGPSGAGKTALAAQIALDSQYPLIRLISAEDMVGYSEGAKIAYITKKFADAYKSHLSVVVLDSIERLIEWVPIGPRFSNPILQTILACLHKAPPREKDRRLLIVATTSRPGMLKDIDIYNDFNAKISVPAVLTYEELAFIMRDAFSSQETQQAIAEIQDLTQSKRVGVGIKDILLAIDTAQQDTDKVSRFAGTMCTLIAER